MSQLPPRVRYSGTHVGKVGPHSVPDEEGIDSVDIFGAILVAEVVTETFFDCDPFADTEIED